MFSVTTNTCGRSIAFYSSQLAYAGVTNRVIRCDRSVLHEEYAANIKHGSFLLVVRPEL
jgi:hypothetical protein